MTDLVKNKHKSYFEYGEFSSASVFKIFSDYFNQLNFNNELEKKHEIKVIAMIRDKTFLSSVRLEERYSTHQVLLEFNNILINLNFEVYKEHGEVQFHIFLTSNIDTYYSDESFFKKLLFNAVNTSELKGSMIEMPRNELSWDKIKIQNRGFGDIFLPQENIDELQLYVKAGLDLNVLMRYLFVGNPGTGKTEATTVIASLLNKHGVTIIKTVVCDKIKDKMQLAKALAPCVLILDDLDLSLGSRNKGVHPERLQDFLDILDGSEKLSKNIGILATTNSTALLDLAAQRPGRFDNYLLFNQLTKSNIKNIILKSLKDNFKINPKNNDIAKMLSDNKIIDVLFSNSVTGAYIYTVAKMIKMKIDMLNLVDLVDIDWILKEINYGLETSLKVKNADFLNDKLSNSSKGIGFGSKEEEEEEYSDDDDDDDDDDDLMDNDRLGEIKKRIRKFRTTKRSW